MGNGGGQADRSGRLLLGVAGSGWVMTRPEQAVLVIGPPRSGKTTSIVVPNVMAAEGPVLSTSTKPDVLRATLAHRREKGRCWLYDPTGEVRVPDGVERLHWSPLISAERWDPAVRMAKMVVGTNRSGTPEMVYWNERAEALLAPLLHAAALAGEDMPVVCRWVNTRTFTPAAEILETAGAQLALDELIGLGRASARELSAVWSSAASALSAYRTSAALETSTGPNFDPAAFVSSGDTVYICAPGTHQAVVAPLVSGLVDQIASARYELSRSHPDRPALLLALDEVANIAPLPDLPALVSEGGGQGVLVLACFQDLSQARTRWGAAADGFMSFFGTKLVLPGVGDVSTLRAVAELCGYHEVHTATSNRSGVRTSISSSWRRQPRLTAEAVRKGMSGAALLIEGREPASWLRLVPPRTVGREGPIEARPAAGDHGDPDRFRPRRRRDPDIDRSRSDHTDRSRSW